jgi:hypothetical protein
MEALYGAVVVAMALAFLAAGWFLLDLLLRPLVRLLSRSRLSDRDKRLIYVATALPLMVPILAPMGVFSILLPLGLMVFFMTSLSAYLEFIAHTWSFHVPFAVLTLVFLAWRSRKLFPSAKANHEA